MGKIIIVLVIVLAVLAVIYITSSDSEDAEIGVAVETNTVESDAGSVTEMVKEAVAVDAVEDVKEMVTEAVAVDAAEDMKEMVTEAIAVDTDADTVKDKILGAIGAGADTEAVKEVSKEDIAKELDELEKAIDEEITMEE